MHVEPDPADSTSSQVAPEAGTPSNLSDDDRALALRAGSAPIPRKFIHWIIIGFAILGLGGFIGDKVLGNGQASSPAALAENTGGQNGVPTGSSTTIVANAPTPTPGPSISVPLSTFLSLKSLGNRVAPTINLVDQSGHSWSLATDRGQILVVTFANAECNDACSVLANEISAAKTELGTRARHVTFVIVNSDPLETSLQPTPPLVSGTALHSLTDFTYLSGSLKRLSAIWSSYGVQVVVQPATRTVTHNDIMYFIDHTGHLRFQVTPFANEGVNGVFTLGAQDTRKFAHGIATVVTKLEGSS